MALIRWGRKHLAILLIGLAALLVQSGWALHFETASICLYQVIGRPITQSLARCRFQPTCSTYALQVLNREGFLRGNWLLTKRLIHCSPLGLLR